jgi:tetrahydromethanopterin S-methyltransferase subunit A
VAELPLSALDAALPAIGEYQVISLKPQSSVALVTLASPELAERMSQLKPEGLSIAGKAETENIGIEKIIQNTLAIPALRTLILCGIDSEGHFAGQTLEAVVRNGVDENGRVIGSKGRKPVLANVSRDEVEAFRSQVQTVNLIGCLDEGVILNEIAARKDQRGAIPMNTAAGTFKDILPMVTKPQPAKVPQPLTATFKDPNQVKLDKEGYFVIVPKAETGHILVEHYSNQNELLHIIQGENARDLYWTILEGGWVSELSHAAYLGKELMAAELSLKFGFKYFQDQA